ncbi:hypothetical protein AMTR_s00113p00028160 [Amborella trichopoda]|uniref:Aminotransferase-like plant mobile domain-containing protein n=1 Tax=Amborella trichopoda TaxID=13333 RepID=W1NPD8_AMBTC|nr:hypothetical protein AMTR_s00113p00028160 [Amborella trichopoda]
MIEDELEVFREEVDLTIDHAPLSYRSSPFVSGLGNQAAWGPAIVGWLYYHICCVTRGARYLRGCAIFLQVRAWEHITIPRPLPGRLVPSFPTIHCWLYRVWDSERLPSRLYYSLFLDTQAVGEIDWTPMRVELVPTVYASSSQAFKTTAHLSCMFLVMFTFPG